jgi:DnaJ-class molecular chaperone
MPRRDYLEVIARGPAQEERTLMDETKDTRRREVLDYEERVEIGTRIGATRRARTCRQCGGYGRFLWGAQDHGECRACRGVGRV